MGKGFGVSGGSRGSLAKAIPLLLMTMAEGRVTPAMGSPLMSNLLLRETSFIAALDAAKTHSLKSQRPPQILQKSQAMKMTMVCIARGVAMLFLMGREPRVLFGYGATTTELHVRLALRARPIHLQAVLRCRLRALRQME